MVDSLNLDDVLNALLRFKTLGSLVNHFFIYIFVFFFLFAFICVSRFGHLISLLLLLIFLLFRLLEIPFYDIFTFISCKTYSKGEIKLAFPEYWAPTLCAFGL